MAGDWLKMRTTLPEERAVLMISELTDLDEFFVIGKLFAVWRWAGQHTVTGKITGVTLKTINKIARCEGFAEAMQSANWLEIDPDGCLIIPRWKKHNAKSEKERVLAAERSARYRQKTSRAHRDGDRDATVTNHGTREEKRRVKKPPLPPKGETPKPAGISKDDLADVDKIRRWLKRRGKAVGLENDHISLTMLVAAAERAIEVGDDPVGLFLHLAECGGKGDWSKISGEQHDRAKLRMRNHNPAATLAETMGVPSDD